MASLARGPALTELPLRARESAAPQLGVLQRFAVDRSRNAAAHAVLLVALVLFALAARRQIRGWEAAGSSDPPLRVFDMPVSTALIVALLLTGSLYERPPMIVVNTFGIIILVPVVRILGRMTKPAPTAAIWLVAILFLLRAWTARFEEWAAVHSQAAVSVNAALKAAGIEMPFPQRDVTLRFPSREET